MLRLMLVGLGCCLLPQFGPGQLPMVVNRPPISLGPPQEVEEASPQVVEFAPPLLPIPSILVFEPIKPPLPALPNILVSDPPLSGIPRVAVLETNEPPRSGVLDWAELEMSEPPSVVPYGRPLTVFGERPTFGSAIGLRDARTPGKLHQRPASSQGIANAEVSLPPLTVSRPPVARFETPRPRAD
jgi:hypothetical protein